MTQDGNVGRPEPGGPVSLAREADHRPDLRTVLLVLVAVILLGWALRAMAIVAVPLVGVILIALAVMPVRDWVRDRAPERLGWLGVTAATAVILLILGVFFGGMWVGAQQVVNQLPTQPAQTIDALQSTGDNAGQSSFAESAAAGAAAAAEDSITAGRAAAADGEGPGDDPDGLLPDTAGRILRMIGDQATGAAAGVAVTILNSALTMLAGLVIVFFLTLLILAESADWREKVQTVARPGTEWRLTESAEIIAGKVRAYLLLRTVLGFATAALYALWLGFFGVELIFVWALLTFLLSFVPVIGSLIAGLLPVAFALIMQDWGTALTVGAGLLVIEQVMGNYVEPKLEGDHIAVSPLVVLLSLLFWSWIWGIPGALLAVPATASLAVLGAHVPALRPWALLLTNRTTMRGLREVTRPK